ncbi:MAG: protein kinase [Planctomycetia bacterium]|nr:protein kinase [Planctomycetia bacterium]
MIDLVGKRLGEFEVVREVGRGGMGVVYEAVQTSLNRRVALKVLGPGLVLTPRAVERFRREAEASAKLHHTNIVPVYAISEHNGIHFYAMELIDGPSLDLVIRQLQNELPVETRPTLPAPLAATGDYVPILAPPPPSASGRATRSSADRFDRAAAMIAEVADALHHAHTNGVTHRDIKPSNLLLSVDGRLSVTDFGLARMLEQPGMTVTGEFVGTPAYMSPEQITAGRVPVDHRTDIYSLGATLYELLALRPPFSAEGRDRLLAMVIQKEPELLRRVNPKVPRDLETICLKCLEKDPDRRYSTAKELADDLRRFVNRFAIQARRAGPLGRLKKWVKRNPALSAAAVVVLLAFVAVGGFAYRSHLLDQEAEEARQHLEDERRNQRREAAQAKAILAAMTGDFPAAEAAIDEALANGASPGESRVLRGYVAHHRGDTVAALDHLTNAVELMPKSVSAHAYRGYLLFYYDDQTQAEIEMSRLSELTPVSPLDYVLKGQVEGIFDPVKGLTSLDRAVEIGNLPLARLVRAEVRTSRALDTADPVDVRAAVDEAAVAKALLPGNPLPLVVSVTANRCAANVLTPAEVAQAKVRAGLDAAELGRFPPSRVTSPTVVFYLDHDGKRSEALKLAKTQSDLGNGRASGNKDAYDALYLYLLGLNGEFKEARIVVDRQIQRGAAVDPVGLFSRAIILAEFGSEGHKLALEEYDRSKLTQHNGTEALYPQLVWQMLGRPTEAVAACRAVRPNSGRWLKWRRGWYLDILKYVCEEIDERVLLQIAGQSRYNQCEAHFFIGMKKLAEGEKEEARKHFKSSVDTDVFVFREFAWSRMFLARMDTVPDWPPWITTKK